MGREEREGNRGEGGEGEGREGREGRASQYFIASQFQFSRNMPGRAEKILYIYIGAHKLMPWDFFLQISQLIRSGAHKLFRRFLEFSQFLTAISRKLWRHLCSGSMLLSFLTLLKKWLKKLKSSSKSAYKR